MLKRLLGVPITGGGRRIASPSHITPAHFYILIALAIATVCCPTAGLAATAPAASAPTPDPSIAPLLRTAKLLDEAVAKYRDNDLKAAEAAAQEATASPGFASLPGDTRYRAYTILGASASALTHYDIAWPALKSAADMPEATGRDWAARLQMGIRQRDPADEVLSLTTIANHWRPTLGQLNDRVIQVVIGSPYLSREHDRQKFELLDALHKAPWKPSNPFDSLDSLWLDLAQLQLARDDVAGAVATAKSVTDPRTMIVMKVDRRFDAITGQDPQHFDLATAAEMRLAALTDVMKQHPDNLQPIQMMAEVLRYLGRNEEALSLVDQALAKALPADNTKSAYKDTAALLPWVMEMRSHLLVDMGRFDEAAVQWERASRRPERGAANVSQTLNLAIFYDELGRPKDALRVLLDVQIEGLSPFGRTELERAKACAYSQMQDAEQTAKSLDYLRDHRTDGHENLGKALLCSGDFDGVADAWKRSLEDPAARGVFLREHQNYDPPPMEPAVSRELHRKAMAVLARPDVRMAIERVGRIEQIHFQDPF